MSRTVAQTIVDALIAANVTHAFAVPGESYLAVLDALHDVRDRLRLVTCRHEAAAANMAEAYGKLRGTPGVAMVTRGPGATHAAIGLHTAQQDSTPMLLLVGQVGTDMLGREAFQEVDYTAVFGTIAKRVITIDRPDRTAELMAAALSAAASGRPGPVVVVLPEDQLSEPAVHPAVAPARIAPPAPDAAALAEIHARLAAAQRPLLLLGGPGVSAQQVADACRFAEAWQMPVVTSWRRKDRFDNRHPLYAGELGLGANPALVTRVKAADLLLCVGARLGENPSQAYTLFTPESAARTLVHIHPDPLALGRVWQPALALHADIGATLSALAKLLPCEAGEVARAQRVTEGARADYLAWTTPTSVQSGPNPAAIIAHLSETLPADTIFANGAGNFAAWLHRFHHHRAAGTQLAPTSGAMGYGVPAGIAAAILHPDRTVVVVAGDGDFLMSGNELATCAHEDARPIFVVLDNGQYGTIRMHQARDFSGRQSGTRLTNPDFAAFARSFGLHGETVTTTGAFPDALARARAAGSAALIHILTDPQEIGPGRRLADGA
ncbi:thiamine pyrophosphate-dependent enzyme [Sandaracinobacteroides saxicola]|uniref:Thiamine pyrophosphate-binding protein n=1 Tax=Sandaracinobacteroides saxicola TaxID=2759707 RepID=A0A7G5II08_9SPHN|nr:thiamine pyrophosphate-dependent enzyme [Sandaracinobacteroides saxicola]QMW23000.1 thiamine pyrophosphate-binding protein [Sandaracinobacteroides saxicola]